MKIINLKAENIKRLSAVDITPEGNVVVVGGKNAAGKTSVLDSIAYALGGKGAIPKKPVKKGKEKAKVIADLGDITVTRTFTQSGGTNLVISNKDGARYPSPQSILDRLTGKISFDPMQFLSMKADEQKVTLRQLIGVDFTEIDGDISTVYDLRKGLNVKIKADKARLEGMPFHEDEPERIDTEELVKEVGRIADNNKAVDNLEHKIESAESRIEMAEDSIEGYQKQISDIQDEIARLKARQKVLRAEVKNYEDRIGKLGDKQDPQPVMRQVKEAERNNLKVVENNNYRIARNQIANDEQAATEYTNTLEQLRQKKDKMISDAKFPVEGLGFDEDGVTFNGLPLDQASLAEQIRVSVAMGIALNPKLKILLIRDASLLDEDNLKILMDMAETEDAQLWIERVGEGDEVSVIIEDGAVKE